MANNSSKLVDTKNRLQWGKTIHTLQNIALPLIAATLVYYQLPLIALALIILGKWRVFAVQPRHWFANVRTNMPDLIVGLGFLTFMGQSTTNFGLALATISYIVWLVFIKPGTSSLMIGAQAMAAQLIGLEALFWFADDISETLLVIAVWVISLVSARHFLSAFDEPLAPLMSQVWALFVTQLAWIMNRWLIVYTVYRNIAVPQIVLVVATIGFVVGSLYYLYANNNLKQALARRYISYGCAIVLLVIVLSDWNAEL